MFEALAGLRDPAQVSSSRHTLKNCMMHDAADVSCPAVTLYFTAQSGGL